MSSQPVGDTESALMQLDLMQDVTQAHCTLIHIHYVMKTCFLQQMSHKMG